MNIPIIACASPNRSFSILSSVTWIFPPSGMAIGLSARMRMTAVFLSASIDSMRITASPTATVLPAINDLNSMSSRDWDFWVTRHPMNASVVVQREVSMRNSLPSSNTIGLPVKVISTVPSRVEIVPNFFPCRMSL